MTFLLGFAVANCVSIEYNYLAELYENRGRDIYPCLGKTPLERTF